MSFLKRFSIPLVATATTLVVRATLLTTEQLSFNHYVFVDSFRWHHVHTGVLVVVLSLALRTHTKAWKLIFALGLGLIVDEPNIILSWFGLPLLSYWHPLTLLLVCILLVTIFVLCLWRPFTKPTPLLPQGARSEKHSTSAQ